MSGGIRDAGTSGRDVDQELHDERDRRPQPVDGAVANAFGGGPGLVDQREQPTDEEIAATVEDDEARSS